MSKSFRFASMLLSLQLTVRYGETKVLDNLDLTLGEGEAVGLVGASGSGKSTLALAVLRLIEYKGGRAEGQVLFKGRDLLKLNARELRQVRGREISFVPQNPHGSLNSSLRLGDHFKEAWSAHSSEKLPASKVLDQLTRLGLPGEPGFFKRFPGELSVGQAQRVLIALAILHKPSLLIADEPTSALDPIHAAESLNLFRQLNAEQNLALLYVSHDMLSVASLCQRIAILEAGRIVETGPTGRIFGAPRHAYTRRLLDAIPLRPSRVAS